MLQYRRNDPSRRRKIKRDQASAPKKGVAGLRMEAGDLALSSALDSLDINSDPVNQDQQGQTE